MKLKLMGMSMSVAVGVAAIGACNTQGPEARCTVALGAFATTYTLKDGQDPNAACAKLTPERVGMQKFFAGEEGGPDSIGMRSGRMGQLPGQLGLRADPAPLYEPTAVGEMATEFPGADNFCDVPELTPARLQAPALAAGFPDGGTLPDGGIPPAQAAQDITYEWSNLRVYNTPQIPGTQLMADLRYTSNGCTAEYKVKGIWPTVSCNTGGKPDETKCDPLPDPSVNRLRGSGINRLFPVKCDPVALICVLTGEVPSDENP
ncbi:MAG TPA: hypothetical protein VF815_36075 [Myxococcaceae bacterium]|jgi:hypothetical protein